MIHIRYHNISSKYVIIDSYWPTSSLRMLTITLKGYRMKLLDKYNQEVRLITQDLKHNVLKMGKVPMDQEKDIDHVNIP